MARQVLHCAICAAEATREVDPKYPIYREFEPGCRLCGSMLLSKKALRDREASIEEFYDLPPAVVA